tara:strand:+ start:118 stop:390 length:273 start_codon:yes stop_codon:yes gene_type:complete
MRTACKNIVSMRKSSLPPSAQPGITVQEITLFDGYENAATSSSPKVLKKRASKRKKSEKRAACPESMIYFCLIFIVAAIITGIIALHFQH